MKGRKKQNQSLLREAALCLLTAALTAAVLTGYHGRRQFALLDGLCARLVDSRAADRTALLQAVGDSRRALARREPADKGLLQAFGYGPADFLTGDWSFDVWTVLLCGTAGTLLSVLAFRRQEEAEQMRIRVLTDYLEKVHMGGIFGQDSGTKATRPYPSAMPFKEGAYGHLQDEIYKTVTFLYRTRDEALAAKKGYADNLQNIAHQLKTPITAISLTAQLLGGADPPADRQQAKMRGQEGTQGQVQGQTQDRIQDQAQDRSQDQTKDQSQDQTQDQIQDQTQDQRQGQTQEQIQDQIQKQLARLTYLEESLLLLARIDAGVLPVKRQAADVFTLLTLAADSLEPLAARKKLSIIVPEMGQVQILADMEWMIEAVMNLFKDCMEHSPAGGAVHCSYREELLYVRIRIWDEGAGFHEEELPHLFRRFYRGKDAPAGGIGIGLALSKELIEMQEGILMAGNLSEGGAFFEIRMYSH